MALEIVFDCPRTRKRLQNGPLGWLLEGFCAWLLEHGFSRYSIRKHLAGVSHLNEYLEKSGAGSRAVLTSDDIDRFFQAYPLWCRHQGPLEKHLRRARYTINRFTSYLRTETLFEARPRQVHYQRLLDTYLDWMRRYQHAADGTLQVRAHSLEQFLRWLGPEASLQELQGLTPERVENFFLACARKLGRAARRSMQSALRTFFRFCLYQGYIQRPLDRAVPTLRTYKLSGVPRGLTDDQAQHVLKCINRTTTAGRRDYAIIQMLYTYGVRGVQLRILRLEDIDWVQNHLLFRAVKQGKNIRVPLTPAVGESLLDYLRNSRPRCLARQVFLTCRPVYQPLPNSNSLSAIVARCIRAAGIEVSHQGAHAFRHCFATRMLKEGYSLKAIADVLGHRCLGTTFIYTKVDINNLKQVALDWPQGV